LVSRTEGEVISADDPLQPLRRNGLAYSDTAIFVSRANKYQDYNLRDIAFTYVLGRILQMVRS
jgi:hypothetical protein